MKDVQFLSKSGSNVKLCQLGSQTDVNFGLMGSPASSV